MPDRSVFATMNKEQLIDLLEDAAKNWLAHQSPRLEAPAFRRGDEKRAALGAEPAKTELTAGITSLYPV